MTDTIDQMDDSLSDETENLLSIIDFPNKRWKKSRVHCNRLQKLQRGCFFGRREPEPN